MTDHNMDDVSPNTEKPPLRLASEFSFASIDGRASSATSQPPQTLPPARSNLTHPSAAGGASVPAPPPRTNPRSCVTCRKRKVRCNKEDPCANCIKAGIECKFPGPGLPPRKARKVPDAELLNRLKRLEGVVNSLGAHVDGDGRVVANQTRVDGARSSSFQKAEATRSGSIGAEHQEENRRGSADPDIGRLVISDDRSRYVSNGFWAKMGDEIAEMRDLLDPPSSEEDDDYDSPQNQRLVNHQEFLFGYSSLANDLQELHPPSSQIFILWEVFKENVDPVVRILHRPTAKTLPLNAASNVQKMSKSGEALLFAIYLGAITSLSDRQCQDLLHDSKDVLIKRYRFATEQALARADFLNSSSLICLQAMVLFLTFVRSADDSRFVWVLTATVTHLARALGIHRDGKHFNLSAFDTEMRRRLWWNIGVLDTRSAEDQGTDAILGESFFDTELPLNINDEDIYPGMKDPPTPRVGYTEMTFTLMRFESTRFGRRLNTAVPGNDPSGINKQTLAGKEALIDECSQVLEEKYLRYCDTSVPLAWVTVTVARLILAKMWLAAHHRRWGAEDQVANMRPDSRQKLFITSIEVMELSHTLEENEHCAKWMFLFRSYMQWQSVAFLLSELCVRPPGPEYERAWRAVEAVYPERDGSITRQQRSMLWKPLRQLMARANARRAALQSGQSFNNVQSATVAGSSNTPKSGQPEYHSPAGSTMSDAWFAGNPSNTVIGSSAEVFGLDMGEFAAHRPGMMDVKNVGGSGDVSMQSIQSGLTAPVRSQSLPQAPHLSISTKNQNANLMTNASPTFGHNFIGGTTASPVSASTITHNNLNNGNDMSHAMSQGYSEFDLANVTQNTPFGMDMLEMEPNLAPYQRYFMNMSQGWF